MSCLSDEELRLLVALLRRVPSTDRSSDCVGQTIDYALRELGVRALASHYAGKL